MAKLDPDFRKTLDAAFDQAINHLEHLDQTSIAATADLATLRERLHKPLARGGVAPEQVVRELNADVGGGLLGSAVGTLSLRECLARRRSEFCRAPNVMAHSSGPCVCLALANRK